MKNWVIIPILFLILGWGFLFIAYFLTGDPEQAMTVGLLGMLSFCSFSFMAGSIVTGLLK